MGEQRRIGIHDSDLANAFRVPELRALEVDPMLAQAILTIPEMDRVRVNDIATKMGCSKDEVKSVLLNERKWRESF
jgi:hypothetical protein